MPLETQLLEIQMLGSLDEQTSSTVLAPGSWLRLDDVQIDKTGEWRKRQGYEFLGHPTSGVASTDTIFPRYEEAVFPMVGGPVLGPVVGVGTLGPTLYSVWLSEYNSPRPPFVCAWESVDTYSTDVTAWEAKDNAPPFVIRRTTEVRSAREVSTAASVEVDGVLWTAYKITDPVAPRVMLRGVDIATGAVVQDDVYFFDLSYEDAPFALVAADGYVVAVYEKEVVL